MIRIIISDGYQNFQLFMLNKFNFSNNPIDAVAILFLTTTILLSPFYIFSSGVAQPSQYIMALCALALMALKRNDFTNLLKKQKISIMFLLLFAQ